MPMHRRLAGLRGMSWGVSAVHYTNRTASWLSQLFSVDPTICSNQLSDHTSSNSKIVYQYLRGERAPTLGPRGKYGHDLTGAVNALPGGAMARLWLNSPLWELLKGHLSAERVRGILSWTREPLPGMPVREYIRAWALYRLSTLEQAPEAEQHERAIAIARLHSPLNTDDRVFSYIKGPLEHYLIEREPQIPLERPRSRSGRKSRLFIKMQEVTKRQAQRQNRFDNGVKRYRRSGRQPDRRFLKEFADPWNTFVRWCNDWDALHAESKEFQRLKAGWEPLCWVWKIPICASKYSLPRGLISGPSVSRRARC